MEDLIVKLLSEYPKVIAALAVVGSVRLMVKPIMSAIKQIAAQTKTEKDNLLIEKVESSKIYKGFVFLVDWITSIKLPVNK